MGEYLTVVSTALLLIPEIQEPSRGKRNPAKLDLDGGT
jgi:hypothetical protein